MPGAVVPARLWRGPGIARTRVSRRLLLEWFLGHAHATVQLTQGSGHASHRCINASWGQWELPPIGALSAPGAHAHSASVCMAVLVAAAASAPRTQAIVAPANEPAASLFGQSATSDAAHGAGLCVTVDEGAVLSSSWPRGRGRGREDAVSILSGDTSRPTSRRMSMPHGRGHCGHGLRPPIYGSEGLAVDDRELAVANHCMRHELSIESVGLCGASPMKASRAPEFRAGVPSPVDSALPKSGTSLRRTPATRSSTVS
mmetsp:Transcript_10807/g.43748  ORF Transcript_10807/g.43748 Transcript_10807/m.43748 type:complete len:258 (+) Transcript_10807:2718-3491(+)